jgi:hypothetical protein
VSEQRYTALLTACGVGLDKLQSFTAIKERHNAEFAAVLDGQRDAIRSMQPFDPKPWNELFMSISQRQGEELVAFLKDHATNSKSTD